MATGKQVMAQVIPQQDYRVVVGMGKTGLSCAAFLRACNLPFCVVDTRTSPPLLDTFRRQFPDVYCQAGNIDPGLLAGAVEIVMSPGVSLAEQFLSAAKAQQVPLVGDIELFSRMAKAPVVAITGSNAKSTVTTLVGEMAKQAGVRAAVGGNLGTPALELLDDAVQLYVLELSSFQLELVHTFHATVAAILNISEDHMDRYHTLQDYVQAKQQVFARCDAAIYNAQDRFTQPVSAGVRQAMTFTLDAPSGDNYGVRQHNGSAWLAKGAQLLLPVSELKLAGRHNVANCLAALAIGDAAGLPMSAMLQVLRTFTGLSHRCQFVADVRGVRYIDDSKGTNVGATIAAIGGLADPARRNIVLIAGGEGKGADFAPLAGPCRRAVKTCVLIGRDARLIAEAIGNATQVVHALDMAGAVQTAASLANAGDLVLLSPACASFDMFRNYEHRGDCFVDAVHALARLPS